MDLASFHGQGRFLDDLRQRRVGVDGTRYVFRASTKLEGRHRLGDHLRGVRAEDVNSKEPVGVSMGDDLDQAGSTLSLYGLDLNSS